MIPLVSIQRRLRRILAEPDLNRRELQLRSLAQELGCSLASTYLESGKHIEEEIVSRIQEAAREERDARLWWIAMAATGASIFSALAAWAAVLRIR